MTLVSWLISHPFRFTLAALISLTWLGQRYAEPHFKRIETAGARFALRKGSVIVGAAAVSIVARVLLLPVDPVPIPCFHDEYSYLLAADTYVHGKLANPPVPSEVRPFLETFHVLESPTYASKYPPGQGMVLALGQMLGNPWIGVLLSMAAMCAALAWALQGWLPARWALLGTLLAILNVDLMSYWVDSYWGGAIAATGGALVIGALPRILSPQNLRRRNLRDPLLLGIGATLLANSRPMEGLLFCLPVAVVLGVGFLRGNRAFKATLATALLPTIIILACTAAWVGYYNQRITGHALLFPNVLYRQLYWDVPVFVWQPVVETAPSAAGPRFSGYFEHEKGSAFHGRSLAEQTLFKCRQGWSFFLGLGLSIPLLAMPWVAFDGRVRLLLIQLVWCGAWVLLVYWFEPHYAAPLTATIFALAAQAMRHLRQWNLKRYRIGVFASRLAVVLLVARVFAPGAEKISTPGMAPTRGWNLYRAQIAGELQATRQKHLIIVRYGPEHEVDHEWVYNAADIDGSKVVWAREIPGLDLKPLLDYYRDRRVWVVDADADHPEIKPYSTQ